MMGTHPRGLRRRVLLLSMLALAAANRPAAQTAPSQSPNAQPETAADPLGRETPAGTVRGFNTAVHRGEFVLAARYLEQRGMSQRTLEATSRDLNDLLDGYFTQRLTALSTAPAGTLDDGLAPEQERLVLAMGGTNVDILLIRSNETGSGFVWLFAAESLARVPELRRSAQATWVERVMPHALQSRSYLGGTLAQWVLWAASLIGPLALFWSLALLIGRIVKWRITSPTREAFFLTWWKGVRWLVVLCLTIVAHLSLMRMLGFSLAFRYNYARAALTIGVVILAMLVWRVISVTFEQARVLALRHGRADTQSLILLGQRAAKVVVATIAIFGLLSLAGLDLTTALAGVGIAGVAIALGAQKSIENLLGGIFLVTDKVLAVGDYCRLSDREGWVEDITLRSVRLRTLQQTLLSVPAGLLSQGSIENFSARRKILIQSVLRLRYGTTAAALEAVLEGVRRLLAEHPQVERQTARIRLVNFGTRAIELEMFAYILTPDYAAFLAAQEDLLLRIAGIVQSSGSDFAAPTEIMQMPAGGHDESDRGPAAGAEAREHQRGPVAS